MTRGRLLGACAVALTVLSVLVATGRTAPLDDWAKELFRPHGQWGDLQVRVDAIVEGLRPSISVTLLAVLTALVALARRTWQPVVSVGIVVAAGAAMTLLIKGVVGRPDPHGEVELLSGSYPSGHVVMVLLLAGCTVLLLWEHPGPLAWSVVAVAGAVMGWALLVQTAHWSTDVLGAVLVGAIVLTLATRMPFARPAGSTAAAPGERAARPSSR